LSSLLSSLYRVSEYIVLQALAGNFKALRAVELYANGHSVSEVSRALGLTKGAVKSVISRVRERCGHASKTAVLAKYVTPVVLEVVKPVIEGDTCRLCRRQLGGVLPSMHILNHHRDYLTKRTLEVLEELRRRLNGGADKEDPGG
jgi:Sigma-70, region 4.